LPSTSATRSFEVSFFGAAGRFALPACAASASMPATISLIAACPRSSAWTIYPPALLRARLDHHDAVLAASHDEVERAGVSASEVGDEQSRHHDPTRTPRAFASGGMLDSASAADAPVMRARPSRCQVGRDHQRDDRVSLRQRRGTAPDRAIDQAAGEHFPFQRLPLALEEPAGDRPTRTIFLCRSMSAAGSPRLRAVGVAQAVTRTMVSPCGR